jgi:hypothetical protein
MCVYVGLVIRSALGLICIVFTIPRTPPYIPGLSCDRSYTLGIHFITSVHELDVLVHTTIHFGTVRLPFFVSF